MVPQANPKVLLIDDDAALTAMLTEFLRGEGFDTTAAFNGTDGAIAALDPGPGRRHPGRDDARHQRHRKPCSASGCPARCR